MDFHSIEHLRTGTVRQQNAYDVLNKHSVFYKLKEFSPILVGSIPINIDIKTSDLDIICCWKNKYQFASTLTMCFGHERGFALSEKIIRNEEVIIARFSTNSFNIEIFGQDKPTYLQNGYLHMIIEHKILIEKGEDFRLQVIQLKEQGYKTEPAFAHLLNLSGDPYDELLKFKNYGE